MKLEKNEHLLIFLDENGNRNFFRFFYSDADTLEFIIEDLTRKLICLKNT